MYHSPILRLHPRFRQTVGFVVGALREIKQVDGDLSPADRLVVLSKIIDLHRAEAQRGVVLGVVRDLAPLVISAFTSARFGGGPAKAAEPAEAQPDPAEGLVVVFVAYGRAARLSEPEFHLLRILRVRLQENPRVRCVIYSEPGEDRPDGAVVFAFCAVGDLSSEFAADRGVHVVVSDPGDVERYMRLLNDTIDAAAPR